MFPDWPAVIRRVAPGSPALNRAHRQTFQENNKPKTEAARTVIPGATSTV